MVSSASSTTDDCWVGLGGCDTFEPDCEDCDVCESRRPVLANDGADDSDVLSMFALPLKLPWRAMEPTPGVWRLGIGGGGPGCEINPVIDPLRAETGGVSSVGLLPRELTVGLDWDFGMGGRQTF